MGARQAAWALTCELRPEAAPTAPRPPAAPSAGYPPRQLGHHLPGTETPRSSRRKMQNPKPGSWRKARP